MFPSGINITVKQHIIRAHIEIPPQKKTLHRCYRCIHIFLWLLNSINIIQLNVRVGVLHSSSWMLVSCFIYMWAFQYSITKVWPNIVIWGLPWLSSPCQLWYTVTIILFCSVKFYWGWGPFWFHPVICQKAGRERKFKRKKPWILSDCQSQLIRKIWR